MATARPTDLPEWNTGLANQTAPNGAKLILGWEPDEEPSSALFNWHMYYAGEHFRWLRERMNDGFPGGSGDQEDFHVRSPELTASGAGGAMHVRAADGHTSGAGGNAGLQAGAGAGSGGGGTATVQGGAGAGSGGGGFAGLYGGAGGATGIGGDSFLQAGDGGSTSGTPGSAGVFGGGAGAANVNGGTANVWGGTARGNGYSKVDIRAADGSQGSGSTQRAPVSYLEADGQNLRVNFARRLRGSLNTSSPAIEVIQAGTGGAISATSSGSGAAVSAVSSGTGYGLIAQADTTSPARSALRVVPQNAAPTTHQDGDLYADSVRLGALRRRTLLGDADGNGQFNTLVASLADSFDPTAGFADISSGSGTVIPMDGVYATNDVFPWPLGEMYDGMRLRIRAMVAIKNLSGGALAYYAGLFYGPSASPLPGGNGLSLAATSLGGDIASLYTHIVTLEANIRVLDAGTGSIAAHGRGYAVAHNGTENNFFEEGQPIEDEAGSVIYDDVPASTTNLVLGVYAVGASTDIKGRIMDFNVEHVS